MAKRKKLHADQLLLIPLRKVCKSTTDVAELIEKIFRDINNKQAVADFEVAKKLTKGKKKALVDALILKPNIKGVGIDLEFLKEFFKGKD